MNKDARIYVAGHRGLVGSSIHQALIDKGYLNILTRSSAQLDLRRQDQTEAFFDAERPEYVFLCAAKVGGIFANNTYKADFIYDNIAIASNVIHSACTYGVKKLLNLGSSCIYPKLAPQPMKESYLLTGTLEPTNEPYAIAKIAAIKLCRYFNDQYGTNFISIMPTNLYGPGDNFDLQTSHVLPALIRKFHLASLLNEGRTEQIARNLDLFGNPVPSDNVSIDEHLLTFGISGGSVTIWGTGEPYREFLYNLDLAEAAISLMQRFDYADIGEFVNIGTGEDTRIKDLATLIKDIVGFSGTLEHDLSKPDGTPRKRLDISRISSLGWKPATSLRAGVKKTYEWYLKHLST